MKKRWGQKDIVTSPQGTSLGRGAPAGAGLGGAVMLQGLEQGGCRGWGYRYPELLHLHGTIELLCLRMRRGGGSGPVQ